MSLYVHEKPHPNEKEPRNNTFHFGAPKKHIDFEDKEWKKKLSSS